MNLPPIYLLRHGETVWNVERRLQGRRDSNLTVRGRAQAEAQGRLLHGVLQDKPTPDIYCSPLGRARETAEIALQGIDSDVFYDERLQEVSAGEWEGRTRPELFEELGMEDGPGTEFTLFTSAPGGETVAELRTRCAAFLSELAGPSVVITHGVTGLLLRGIAMDLDEVQLRQLERGQGCIYHLQDGVETCLKEN
ncbi:Putative phosphoserine phosphatase 2 [Roseovarius albus]|uniref:Putative phosphoserine phosphatase 2 n=1 Tax=Roseovarius albus TaxID=1247867 RepID=A0A1X6ZAS2_9RHOB|nr:histidine phosphatase family protein [Roseovarius albus]SLN43927.1 Putative phosphoserine phosphatase 2 [Roseovarius albus]